MKIRLLLVALAGGMAVVGSAILPGAPASAEVAVPAGINSVVVPYVWTKIGTYDTYDECAYNGANGVHRGYWKNYQCHHALKWELWVLY